eukprot:COSAG06_NODE_6280_length_3001_cov_2.106134_6_plen_101_part_00
MGKVEQTGDVRRVISAPPWLNRRMNCSYNNGIMDCMGTCVSADMPPDGEAALRLAAARLQATGPFIPTANPMFFPCPLYNTCVVAGTRQGQCTEQTGALN